MRAGMAKIFLRGDREQACTKGQCVVEEFIPLFPMDRKTSRGVKTIP